MFATIFRKEILDQILSPKFLIVSLMKANRAGGKVDCPAFRYKFPSFAETLKDTAPDIVLLALFNLIFFAAAYYSFTRYDAR
jgi:hypothetical protein